MPSHIAFATDAENLTSSAEYAVIYSRPFFRSAWFYGALAAMKRAVELAPDNEDLQQAYKTLQEGP